MRNIEVTLKNLWEEFFTEDHIFCQLKSLSIIYPEERSFVVPYQDISNYSSTLATHLTIDPEKTFRLGEEKLREVFKPFVDHFFIPLRLRVTELPNTSAIPIRSLRNDSIGCLVAVSGLLRKVTQVRPKVEIAAFMCPCGHVQKVKQTSHILSEPLTCPEDDGGCGKKGLSSHFTLLPKSTHFIDSQKAELQESPNNIKGGAQPERLIVYLEGDITGIIQPGDEVTFNGIIDTQERRVAGQKSVFFNSIINVNSIQMEESRKENIEVTEQDLKEIYKLAQDPNLSERLISTIAPNIYGLSDVKEALALQLFGGRRKTVPGGSIRGDIHILLIGDPGTAKSQLLRHLSELAPRSVFASGQAASKAGLTATAVKDEFGEGRWTLEAGALVLGDNGLVCVDELDKMNSEDRSSMHDALEQQKIDIAKAGISATLRTRCSLLAAANPKEGRFDPYKSIIKQINLPQPLITRFDAIFFFRDIPNNERDEHLARHVMTVHCESEVEAGEGKERIDEDLFRKYLTYAKTINPIMPVPVQERLINYYKKIRNAKRAEDEESGRVPITPRQFEALIRFSEASARSKLQKKVGIKDAERAIHIVESYIKGLNNEGFVDFDVIETGISFTRRTECRDVRAMIADICKETGARTAPLEQISEVWEMNGGKEIPLDPILSDLLMMKVIFKTQGNRYGVMVA